MAGPWEAYAQEEGPWTAYTPTGQSEVSSTAPNIPDKEQRSSIGNFFYGLIGIKPEYETDPTKVIPSNKPTKYPTSEEAEFAKKNEFAYGQSWEKYFTGEMAKVRGRPGPPLSKRGNTAFITANAEESVSGGDLETKPLTDPETGKYLDLNAPENSEIKAKISDTFARAALAVNRSAIASLGFSPAHTMLDVKTKREDGANFGETSTRDKSYPMYSSFAAPSTSTQDSVVHESLHRGLLKLRETNEEAKDILGPNAHKGEGKIALPDELIVRYIMSKTMGNIEAENPKEGPIVERAIERFEQSLLGPWRVEFLKRIEELAAEEIAKKRPGGPR